jgi:1-acyl-sn-glycerol-3-phosphate acyltransferase
MATRTESRQPEDLFEPTALDGALRDLLGPRLDALVVATRGPRTALHEAEREWAAAAVDALDIQIAVAGLDRIDPSRSYLVAPLHEGFADVLAVLQLPLDLTWVIRDELLDLPYFGAYLVAAGYVAITPETPRAALRTMLRGARAAFAGGESLVVFPQGSLLGVETAFQSGAFQLAERFGVAVLPVVLTGSHRVWDYPFTANLRRGQSIRMTVLDPIEPALAVATMRGLEREMKRRALAVTDAPARRYQPEHDGTWEGYRFEIDPDFPEVAVRAGR